MLNGLPVSDIDALTEAVIALEWLPERKIRGPQGAGRRCRRAARRYCEAVPPREIVSSQDRQAV